MQIFRKNKIIIHCCTQKTGSQWFIPFLNDILEISNKNYANCTFVDYRKSVIFRDSDYKRPSYALQRELYTVQNDKFGFDKLKKNSLYASFYVGPAILNYLKPNQAKVFFILRDPRDLVISWYYSSKYSHTPTEDIDRVRAVLNDASFEDGIKYSIDQMSEFGLFEGVRGWMNIDMNQTWYKVYLYEDFVEQYENFCMHLISFIGLNKDNNLYIDVINKHSFRNYSKGREKGETDKKSHYRSGSTDQWKDEFTEELIEYFEYKTNHLGKQYDRKKNEFKIQLISL
ncbi:sulfotransferase domain-containing protein [Aequorivita todarodis]|uniref:sulfotransferase domain-containing protein n=1 Tax=Aequorivita todarodis TaxID=2036821 RepID=UPI00234FD50C|nr:sulfotransferase domain-containing protein [Aequorivita todarodis]MDC8000597.1 sulfotransferase domain-containing protein [Aequorivita todarodis]